MPVDSVSVPLVAFVVAVALAVPAVLPPVVSACFMRKLLVTFVTPETFSARSSEPHQVY